MEDPAYKAALLEMAQRWRELAARAPRQEEGLSATSFEDRGNKEELLGIVPTAHRNERQD